MAIYLYTGFHVTWAAVFRVLKSSFFFLLLVYWSITLLISQAVVSFYITLTMPGLVVYFIPDTQDNRIFDYKFLLFLSLVFICFFFPCCPQYRHFGEIFCLLFLCVILLTPVTSALFLPIFVVVKLNCSLPSTSTLLATTGGNPHDLHCNARQLFSCVHTQKPGDSESISYFGFTSCMAILLLGCLFFPSFRRS